MIIPILPFLDTIYIENKWNQCYIISQARDLIFNEVKSTYLSNLISYTATATNQLEGEYDDPPDLPKVNITIEESSSNFLNAFDIHDNKVNMSIFGQLYNQLKNIDPVQLRRHYVSRRPFLTDLQQRTMKIVVKNVETTDHGAIYRDMFLRVSREIQLMEIPLFTSCSNNMNNFSFNGDKIIPNLDFILDKKNKDVIINNLGMYRFLGRLIGISIRNEVPFSLIHIPSIIWKALVQEDIVFKDIHDIDQLATYFINQLSSIEIDPKVFDELFSKFKFISKNSNGSTIQLTHNGDQKVLKYSTKSNFISLYQQSKLNEFLLQMKAMRIGLYEIIPSTALTFYSWEELRDLVCGVVIVSVDHIKDIIVIMEPDNSTIESFWRVVESMKNEERCALLNFFVGNTSFLSYVDGRVTRENGTNNSDSLSNCICVHLVILDLGDEDDTISNRNLVDKLLPSVNYISMTLSIPQYSSDEVMKKQLLRATLY